jgi:putative DNA primase/helicase
MAGDDETPGQQQPGASDKAIPADDGSNAAAAEPAREDSILGEFAADADFRGNISATELTEDEEARRSELHAAAVHYWELGFRCIPLHHVQGTQCSCGDPGCSSPGKHPLFGNWQVPDMDPDADASWWRRLGAGETSPINWEPRAGIGILTGEPSGVFALDIDVTSVDGFETLGRLEGEHPEEPIPATLTVTTGSRGRHYYFAMPSFSFGNAKPWGKSSGIDIKADKGFTVAPPSISGFGGYSFLQNVTSIGEVAKAPSWILQALREHQSRQFGQITGNPPAVPDKLLRAYMASAIGGVASMLRHAPEGERNNTLNAAAFRLGQFGAHGLIAEAEARQVLTDAGLATGMTRREVANTITSGWHSGLDEPADLSKVGQLTDHEWALHPWNSFGLADRLVVYFGEQLRFVEETGSWLTYTAGTWRRCTDAEPQRLAQDMIRLLPEVEAPSYGEEIVGNKESSPQDAFLSWVDKCCNRTAVASTVLLARDRPAIREAAARFDENELRINLRNGVWDPEEGTLIAHDPGQLMTMQAGVPYDERARCPLWDEFMARMQPDPAMRAFLYRCWGMSLTADLGERAFFLHHGPTATGKSVMNAVISSVAGSYSQTVPVETLLLSSVTGGVPTDLARMVGKRYLSASETRAGKQLNEALVKQLTGGDTIAARFMRQDFFEFRPSAKIHLISNHLVHLSNDSATQDRIHLIKWEQSVPPRERDKRFATRIFQNEGSGVLNRLLEGLADWLARGELAPPGTAEDAKTEFLRSEDWREAFVAEACRVVPPQAGVVGRSTAELFQQYKLWSRDVNPHAKLMSKNSFSNALAEKWERVNTTVRGEHWRGFPGLEIKPMFGVELQLS